MRAAAAGAVAAVVVLAGCGGSSDVQPEPMTALSAPAAPSSQRVRSAAASTVVVRYRIERRTGDPATASFADVVQQTLVDPRGWQRAGFRLIEALDAPYLVVLAEAAEVDRLCRPYDTFGKYSCQNGPVVAINADRWRTATPEWTGDLATYRRMLVNHEVGHLLGQHHPPSPLPRAGPPRAGHGPAEHRAERLPAESLAAARGGRPRGAARRAARAAVLLVLTRSSLCACEAGIGRPL